MPTGVTPLGISVTVQAKDSTTLGLVFDVPTINVVGVPIPRNVHNQYDEFGLYLSLQRLTAEKNLAYKKRLIDVYVNAAGSDYRGLVNGITRELGLGIVEAVVFEAKKAPGGGLVGTVPVIEIDGPLVRVWGDFREDDEPELEIDRFDLSIGELIDAVNVSIYFSMTVKNASVHDRAMTLINQNSINIVTSENLDTANRINLVNDSIVEGSAFFSDTSTFSTKVADIALVTEDGEYFIDNGAGLIVIFSVPRADATVRYQYLTDPLIAVSSPVIIHDLQSEEFRKKMFEQILQDDNTFENGLPTQLGADLINELISVIPFYWGK